MPNTDMATGITERMIYGAIIAGTAKLVGNGYMTADMQMYVAGGGVAAFGSVYAWWNNRPGRLLDRAAAQLPPSAQLVIATTLDAPRQEKDAANELASAAGDKVVAKVSNSYGG